MNATIRTIKAVPVTIKITQKMIDRNNHCTQTCPFYEALMPHIKNDVSVYVDKTSVCYRKNRGRRFIASVRNDQSVIDWIVSYDLDKELSKPGKFNILVPTSCIGVNS